MIAEGGFTGCYLKKYKQPYSQDNNLGYSASVGSCTKELIRIKRKSHSVNAGALFVCYHLGGDGMHKPKKDYMRGAIAAKYSEVHEPTPCNHIWCGDKAINEYYERIDSMAKDFAAGFYKSKAWIGCRDGYIKSVNGLCERCLAKGQVVPGKIVHHKIYITPQNINDPDITLNWDNLELHCQDCHNQEHHAGEATGEGLMFDGNGELVKI